MEARAEIEISSSKEAIWNVITDIDNTAKVISGIESVEILDRPESGFVGFKWKETRIFMGKTATEIMWIVDSTEYSHYSVRAESHGSVYLTDFRLEDSGSSQIPSTKLSTGFRSIPESFGAKFMNFIFGKMMTKASEKAFFEDLKDIKKKVEK